MNKILIAATAMLLLFGCEDNSDVEYGVSEKLKEITKKIIHKKDSIIDYQDSIITELRSESEVLTARVNELESDKDNDVLTEDVNFGVPLGQEYKGYMLQVVVTKSDKYDRYPNKVHGRVIIAGKTFHQHTIYSADCSIVKARRDVLKNLKSWVDN